MNVLEVRDLVMAYDRHVAVDGLSFDVPQGCVMAIVGPNGSGKTTTLKGIVGAVRPRSGVVRLSPEIQRRSGLVYVPQRASVDWDFPLRVRDVVEQGRAVRAGWFGRLGAADRELIDRAMDQVAMRDLAERQIGELSGGQQQRTFLARALAQDGDFYVMDEPFQGVDAATEHAIVEVLRELKSAGRTVLVVHHDLTTVRAYFDRVLLMNRRAVACGPTHEVFHRENLQATYEGRLVQFDGEVVA